MPKKGSSLTAAQERDRLATAGREKVCLPLVRCIGVSKECAWSYAHICHHNTCSVPFLDVVAGIERRIVHA